MPLGRQRLITVEVVLKMLKLKKELITEALKRSQIFKNVIDLVKAYPWNNFLQLKVINICDFILDDAENEELRKHFLASSGIAHTLVEMSKEAMYTMKSERVIRNGYMALVVKVSNKLQLKYGGSKSAEDASAQAPAATPTGDQVVVDYLDSAGEEWKDFIDNELKNSNEKNNKTLGGSSASNKTDEEDDKDENSYEIQMEKIMARFTSFNHILSQGSSPDDDEDDEDDETQEDKEEKNFDEDDDDHKEEVKAINSNFDSDSQGLKIEKVELKEPEPLKEEFVDSNYWKLDNNSEDIDVDALYDELED